MQADFWHQKWQKNEIGFHLPQANPLLVKHFSTLQLTQGARVLVPLCGKTLDIAWLLTQGYQVAGVELSEIAVKALFDALGVMPTITQIGALKHYHAENLDVFLGDLFALTASNLGKVDAVYDRAALVALPADMRVAYTQHLMAMTHNASQLLICFEYDQRLHAGPPFSITALEVQQHYQQTYHLTCLASEVMEKGLKGQFPATEQVWLLNTR